MKTLTKLFVSCCLLFSFCFMTEAQTLNLKFTNIRNSEGVFRIGIYTDEESFKKEDPKFYRTASKSNAKNGEMVVPYSDLAPGIYGIVVLDDENSNDKTDYGIFLPEEGFGFSNYSLNKLSVPDFSDFDFKLGQTDLTVTIRITYL